MSGVTPTMEFGPATFTVTEAVTGGQLIEARAGSVVGVAAAGSLKVLGVAMKDGRPASPDLSQGTTAYGIAFTDVSAPLPTIPVRDNGYFQLTYAAAANFGDKLIAAANGQVTPVTVATQDPRTIVGYCAEPAGVAAGGVGSTRIHP